MLKKQLREEEKAHEREQGSNEKKKVPGDIRQHITTHKTNHAALIIVTKITHLNMLACRRTPIPEL